MSLTPVIVTCHLSLLPYKVLIAAIYCYFETFWCSLSKSVSHLMLLFLEGSSPLKIEWNDHFITIFVNRFSTEMCSLFLSYRFCIESFPLTRTVFSERQRRPVELSRTGQKNGMLRHGLLKRAHYITFLSGIGI